MKRTTLVLILASVLLTGGAGWGQANPYDVSNFPSDAIKKVTVGTTTGAKPVLPTATVNGGSVVITPTSVTLQKPTTTTAAQAPAVTTPPKTESYTVKKGDSLWAIALKYLKDGTKYLDIIKANKDKYPELLKNPNLIQPGWQLVIPIGGTNVVISSGNPASGNTTGTTGTQTSAGSTGTAPTPAGTTTTSKPPVKPELPTAEKAKILEAAVLKHNARNNTQITEFTPLWIDILKTYGYLTDEQLMQVSPPV